MQQYRYFVILQLDQSSKYFSFFIITYNFKYKTILVSI